MLVLIITHFLQGQVISCYNISMKILGIESSCDETAAAVVENGVHILSNVVVSQIDVFAAYGGVIPEIAARSHLEAIQPVIDKALKDANCDWSDIDAIAVTHAPGLLGSLLIGTLTARTLSILHDKPLYAVHHLKSHIYANWLETSNYPAFPLLAAVISGGHTQIIKMQKHNDFKIIGTTTDDAIGESFDKVAKILGLPYPGGPSIAEKAEKRDPEKYQLPHPKTENPLDFSFSGLKTAVLRLAQKEANLPITAPSKEIQNHLTDQQKSDIAASFQKAAIDILLEKLQKALEKNPETQSIVLAGGVSANQKLRKETEKFFSEDLFCFFPPRTLSGDNAAMVAAAAYFEIKEEKTPTNPYNLNIYPRIEISKS